MRTCLMLHPDSACAAARGVTVEATHARNGHLELRYVVEGEIGALLLPARAEAARTDELWRHTCFEAFVRADGEAYYEFNFSPSTQWAAYRFDSYRAGMRNADSAAPRVDVSASADQLLVSVALELAALRGVSPDGAWRMALTCVLEETNGAKSYWALAHAPGAPDFHNSAGFAFELPPRVIL